MAVVVADPRFGPETLHRVNCSARQTGVDVSEVAATGASIILCLTHDLDIHEIIGRLTTAAAASTATINIGTVGDLAKFGSISITSGLLINTNVRGSITDKKIPAGTPVVVSHVQDADNTAVVDVFVNHGISAQAA